MRAYSRMLAVAGVFVLGTAALVGATQQTASGPAPTRIGVIDLARLINDLDELKDRNGEIQAKATAYKKELDKIKEEAEALQRRLEHEVPRTDIKLRIEVRTQLAEKMSLGDARKKAYETLLELENGEIIRGLYEKVGAAAGEFAKREGYDMLFMDDRGISLDANTGIERVNATIQNKRVIYAADELNVTMRLLTKMNNDYKASGGKPAAAPTGGAKKK